MLCYHCATSIKICYHCATSIKICYDCATSIKICYHCATSTKFLFLQHTSCPETYNYHRCLAAKNGILRLHEGRSSLGSESHHMMLSFPGDIQD
jgi:hypothetical protein